ncbi:hypothetical protein [Sphingomonas kyungheensis]|uniref:Uncharacterized protein n=1 Tax=Sphingomonas kyungheensis TaxID=1069987 RepID=A0ABU8H3Y8_9SPHN
MRFRRISDGQMVSDNEACDAAGTVKDGYAVSESLGQRFIKAGDYLSFDMMMLDSAIRGTSPAAPRTLSDAESACIVARAASEHRTRNAYLGDRAPAFTNEMAAAVLAQAESTKAQLGVLTAKANDAAPGTLSSNERAYVVARAESDHRTRNAYLGDRAPAFTVQMAEAAVAKVEADNVAARAQIQQTADAAEFARGASIAARAQMIEGLNSWRK